MATDESGTPIGDGHPASGSENSINGYRASLLGIYLIAMSITLSYMLYNLWPPQLRSKGPAAGQVSEQQAAGRRVAKPDNANANANANAAAANNTNAASTAQPNANAAAASGNNNSGSRNNPPGNNTNNNNASASTGGRETTAGENANKEASTQNDTRTAAEEGLPTVSLFGGWLVLTHSVEVRLLLIVLLAGALGSYIHAATSFVDFVGNRKLTGEWIWWYLLRPFIGMTLALVFYFVVRGGFISPNAGGSDMNPFGIAAMAGLVGMFSKQAIDKLNDVFTSLFASKGDDKRGGSLVSPTVTTLKPNSGPTAGGLPVTISGTGFSPGARVTFGTAAASGVIVDGSGKNIAATTPPHAAGKVDVEVTNPNTEKGTLPNGFEYKD